MSWINLIQEQVTLGFNILDDLVRDIVWNHRTNPIFDDGSYTYKEDKNNVGGVVAAYEAKRIDGNNILQGDQELIVQQIQVDNLGSDDLFTVLGKLYKVIDFDQDPASVTWVIQLRAA